MKHQTEVEPEIDEDGAADQNKSKIKSDETEKER
jgi:hypothetical protein